MRVLVAILLLVLALGIIGLLRPAEHHPLLVDASAPCPALPNPCATTVDCNAKAQPRIKGPLDPVVDREHDHRSMA